MQDLDGASEATKGYLEAVEAIGERGIDSTVSLKLSQLGLTVDRAACAANLNMILERAKQLGVGVEVDMEQSDLVDATLELFREAAAAYPATRLAIQVCLRRTVSDLESLASLQAPDAAGQGRLRRADRPWRCGRRTRSPRSTGI